MRSIPLLAQSSSPTASILWLLMLLLGAVVVLGVALVLLRRHLLGPRDDSTGLTLHDLRTLHAQGAMSDEEFEAARDAILAGHERAPNPLTGEPRARSGFDLTGDPLPGQGEEREEADER